MLRINLWPDWFHLHWIKYKINLPLNVGILIFFFHVHVTGQHSPIFSFSQNSKRPPGPSISFSSLCWASLHCAHICTHSTYKQHSHAYREPPSWVRNAAWELFLSWVRTHIYSHTEKKTPTPCSLLHARAGSPSSRRSCCFLCWQPAT